MKPSRDIKVTRPTDAILLECRTSAFIDLSSYDQELPLYLTVPSVVQFMSSALSYITRRSASMSHRCVSSQRQKVRCCSTWGVHDSMVVTYLVELCRVCLEVVRDPR